MSSSKKIPAELYYLDPSFSLRSARKYQLLDILYSNGVTEFNGTPISENFQRAQLMQAFKKHILARKSEIIQEYNRNQIEEYLRTDTEGEDSEELSEEDDLSEPEGEEETLDQQFITSEESNNNYNDNSPHIVYSVSTGKRVSDETPEKIYPTLENQGLNSEILENDTLLETPTHTSHRWSLRNRNRRKADESNSEDDADFIPEYDDEEEEESESEDDLGDIARDELYLLRTDQNKPPETYEKPRFHMVTRAQEMAFKEKQSLLWKRRGIALCGILTILFTGILSASVYQRSRNGYCQNYPIALESNNTGLFHIPSPCIPCPAHGICKNGGLICEALYERRTPFYNIGNMFPIADECVHNSVLGRYVARVERSMKKNLATHQGNMVCEYLISHPDYTDAFPVSKLPVNELIAKIRNEEHDRLPEDRIDEIMLLALTAVIEDPNTHFSDVDGERLIGVETPKFTFGCGIKSRYHSFSLKTKLGLLVLITFTISLYGVFKDYKRNQVYKKQIDKLVKKTINALKLQKKETDHHLIIKAQKHVQDKSITPALSVPQLRSLSVDVNDRQTIKDWEQVLKQIQTNPHIRKSFQEVRGDPVEFWELIA
ncbi:hypothetical protein K501DRAFT_334653 [Backusella circina FSU 941]|nr:hypothetical protein K501DRAFT_334653 [Backusella circina FSU 941]